MLINIRKALAAIVSIFNFFIKNYMEILHIVYKGNEALGSSFK
jgi:hypothetical protein